MQDVTIDGFAPELASEVEEVVDHFNGSHADTVLFIARFAGETAEAEAAEIAGVSPDAVTLATRAGGEATRVRVAFGLEVGSLDQLRAGMLGLLGKSRERAGADVAPTSIEREITSTRSLPTFVAQVQRARDVSPNLRELTLSGGLEAFAPLGGDQFVYVMTPRAGNEAALRDGVTMAELRALPEAERPASAYYTVRAFRPAAGELDLWFVVHDHASGVSGWASRAAPGDRVALWGPRRGFEPPEDTRTLWLLGDETALPAIAAILEETELDVHAIVETVDASHAVDLPGAGRHRVDWVFRGDRPAHESPALLNAVREAWPAWRDGVYAFGAGEASRILPLRRHLRGLGATPDRIHLVPYWRHGRALNG